jgi:hypothetical protein
MHRVTAKLLLILLLVGVSAPAALAITLPSPHACCLRKPMHGRTSHNAEFNGPPGCCQHDCCRPLTVSQWAQLTQSQRSQGIPTSSTLQARARPSTCAAVTDQSHSGRAPPQFFIS